MDTDLASEQLGTGGDGQPVWLRDIWPSQAEIGEVIASCLRPDMYTREYAQVFAGDERWRSLPVPAGDTFAWDPASTYVRRPPFFDGLTRRRLRWPASTAPGCSPCSATQSPLTTSPGSATRRGSAS